MKKTNNEIKHTAHSSYRCQYHIVFAPKYRRKEIYGQLRRDIGEILRKLCEQKGVEIIEAEICVDHIHMLVTIPPYLTLVRGIEQNECILTCSIGDAILIITMHNDCIPQSATGGYESAEPFSHILLCYGKGFACGREAEYLIFKEGYSFFDVRPIGIFDNNGGFREIIENIGDIRKHSLIRFEKLLGIEGQV